MRPSVLKLGTRRSALARAQSAAVARELEQLHAGLKVNLAGIETRGDRIQDRPLSSVQGKEFFTAEIDTALLEGEVDFTVHSYKDLSLERTARLRLAAVPRREQPHDIAVFARDVPERLAAGFELAIGTSSPRRMSFVPDLLKRVLPRAAPTAAAARIRLVDLRGNVDSRLRRLHEPRGSPRQLDGIVLAFAGLARLWGDEAGRALLEQLFSPLPRMVLPLSACPAAPAQGALGIECRAEDAVTAQLLAGIDHVPTRRAVDAERALLAERGGGCHQRFGATQIEVPDLGALLYLREDGSEPQLRWTPAVPLAAPTGAVRPWDGRPAERADVGPDRQSCGLAAPPLREPLLQLPSLSQWTVLTHAGAVSGWAPGQVIATYRHREASAADEAAAATPADATHLYWHSSAQFERWRTGVAGPVQHACGPGKTYQHLLHAGVQNLRMFPAAVQWRTWLGL